MDLAPLPHRHQAFCRWWSLRNAPPRSDEELVRFREAHAQWCVLSQAHLTMRVRTREDGSFVGWIPALPAVGGDAPTLEELGSVLATQAWERHGVVFNPAPAIAQIHLQVRAGGLAPARRTFN